VPGKGYRWDAPVKATAIVTSAAGVEAVAVTDSKANANQFNPVGWFGQTTA
jgi:hypothetical protein